jgi:epoxyqueuosine reductase
VNIFKFYDQFNGSRKEGTACPLFVDFPPGRFYYADMQVFDIRRELETTAQNLGAAAFGFCRVDDLAATFHYEIRSRAEKLPYAISVGIALQRAVLETLENRPNQLYKAHYKTTNSQLDQITFRLGQIIAGHGYNALPIPASVVLSRKPPVGHLNHREIAFRAGLGWRGKNNLLVHPVCGGRLRLATILTDMELELSKPQELNCGRCHACAKRCPADAIGDTPEAFDLEKCRLQVIRFSKENDYGHQICGLCLNCCPDRSKKSMSEEANDAC